MLLLQALLALLRRSLGKVVAALFGWAVFALFGEVKEDEKALLSAVIGGAAIWPLLLIGIALPREAALILTLVPIPRWVPGWLLRLLWVVLTALVPVVVGLTLAWRGTQESERNHSWVTVLRGFPITVGVAGAFLLASLAWPVKKLRAVFQGRVQEHVPLIVPADSYHEVAAELRGVLDDAGIRIRRQRPPWSVRAISRTLRAFGGKALAAQIPDRLEFLQGPSLELVLYPNGVSLLGTQRVTARAHALIGERAGRTKVFQTTDADAQKVESRIKDLWNRLGAGIEVSVLRRELTQILAAVAELEISFDQWEIVYRETLQLALELRGGGEILKRAVESRTFAETLKGKRRKGRVGRLTRRARQAPSRTALASAANAAVSLAQKLAGRTFEAFRSGR